MPRPGSPFVPSLAALALAALVLLPLRADAGFPDPANSSIPNSIVVVGLGAAGPDVALGNCEVIYRDLANNPVPGAVVRWDFSACDAIWIAGEQHDPSLTVDCGLKSVSAVTDLNGIARFTFVGGGFGGGSSGPQNARVYASGVLLGAVKVAAYDLDGSGGVTLADLSLWASDFFGGANPDRANYDGDPAVTLADLSRWAGAFFAGNEIDSGAPHCP